MITLRVDLTPREERVAASHSLERVLNSVAEILQKSKNPQAVVIEEDLRLLAPIANKLWYNLSSTVQANE